MAIDASIYSQIRQPEAFNPLAELAQAQQLQTAQTQNKLASLGLQDRERSQADAAAQQAAVRGFGADQQANYNRLLQTGNLKAATDYQKSNADLAKTGAETSKTGADAAEKTFANYQAQLGTVADPQQAAAFVTASYHDPVIGPILQKFGPLEQGLQRLQQASQDPQSFQQWKAQAAIGMQKLAEMAKVQNVNLGGTMVTQSVQPATGQVTQLGSAPITQSADNQASNATSRANNAATVGASYANAGALRDQAQATRDAANIQTGFKNEAELRKEFEQLPEIKNYKQAYPAYAAVKDAAGRNTPQSDINLVYGIAKLYDPTSVVREGEYATVANSPSIPEKVKGYAQYLAGGGRLSADTKKQILAEAQGRIGSYRTEADKARTSYTNIAKQRGMNPEMVLQQTGDAPAGPTAAAPANRPPLSSFGGR